MSQHPPFYLYHLDRRRNALMLSRLMRRWQPFLALTQTPRRKIMKMPFGANILDRLTGDASPEVREKISLTLIAYALVSRDAFVLPLVLLDSGLRGQAILDAISGTCCVGCLAKKLVRQRLEAHFPEHSELTTEMNRCDTPPDVFDALRAAFPGVEIKGVQA